MAQEARREIEKLRAELVCPICHGELQAATFLLCSHVFCSYCIRRATSASPRCPVCQYEGSLNPHPLQIINTVLSSLSRLSRVLEEAPPTPPMRHQEAPRRSKRKLEKREEGERGEQDSSSSSATLYAECVLCACKVAFEELDAHEEVCAKKKKKKKPAQRKKRRELDEEEEQEREEEEEEEEHAEEEEQQEDLEARVSQRMGRTYYKSMKEATLRSRCVQLGFSASALRGVRKDELQKIHEDYVMRWNADCDDVGSGRRRKSQKEIVQLVMEARKHSSAFYGRKAPVPDAVPLDELRAQAIAKLPAEYRKRMEAKLAAVRRK